MALTEYDYEIHLNVAGHHGVLEKLKIFADSKGWTIDHFEQNKFWENQGGGTYGFSAGAPNETFLQLTGNATADNLGLTYRLRGFDDGDPDNQYVQLTWTKDGNETFSTSTSEHPVDQNERTGMATSHEKHGFSPGVIPQVWLMGDDEFLLCVAEMNGDFCQMLSFGSINLFKTTSQSNGGFIGHTSVETSGNEPWTQYANGEMHNPFIIDSRNTTHKSFAGGSGLDRMLLSSIRRSGSNHGNAPNHASHLLFSNAVAGIRPIIQPIVYWEVTTDNWQPMGLLPVGLINYTGLKMGEIFTYGSDNYIVFPDMLQSRAEGIVVKINVP